MSAEETGWAGEVNKAKADRLQLFPLSGVGLKVQHRNLYVPFPSSASRPFSGRNHFTSRDSFHAESRGCHDDKLLPNLAEAKQKYAAFRARPRQLPKIEGPISMGRNIILGPTPWGR